MADHRRAKRAKRFLADLNRARNVQFYMCHRARIFPERQCKGKNGIGNCFAPIAPVSRPEGQADSEICASLCERTIFCTVGCRSSDSAAATGSVNRKVAPLPSG